MQISSTFSGLHIANRIALLNLVMLDIFTYMIKSFEEDRYVLILNGMIE